MATSNDTLRAATLRLSPTGLASTAGGEGTRTLLAKAKGVDGERGYKSVPSLDTVSASAVETGHGPARMSDSIFAQTDPDELSDISGGGGITSLRADSASPGKMIVADASDLPHN